MTATGDHRDTGIRRRADGSIDTEFYADRAMTSRAAAVGEARAALAGWLKRLAAVPLRRRNEPQPRLGGPAR